MRKVLYLSLFLLLVAAVLLLTGYNPLGLIPGSSPPKPPAVDVGIVAVNQSEDVKRINFLDIKDAATQVTIGKNATPTTPLHYHLIKGSNLDDQGDASSWFFIIRQGTDASLVAFDQYGQKNSLWPGRYPDTEINLAGIMAPRDLFALNHDTIFPKPDSLTTENRNIAVSGDRYYLTITGPTETRNLEFNATTGAMTQSHD